MCAFCAAIPATLAIGANLKAKQFREQHKASEGGKSFPKERTVPIGTITIVTAGALVAASLMYHSQSGG
jgi:hypothetical protein